MSQSITLSDEQHEFRRVLRQFCDAKVVPLAVEIDRAGEYSWETFEALKSSMAEAYEGTNQIQRMVIAKKLFN